jgi:hypothetical protein
MSAAPFFGGGKNAVKLMEMVPAVRRSIHRRARREPRRRFFGVSLCVSPRSLRLTQWVAGHRPGCELFGLNSPLLGPPKMPNFANLALRSCRGAWREAGPGRLVCRRPSCCPAVTCGRDRPPLRAKTHRRPQDLHRCDLPGAGEPPGW